MKTTVSIHGLRELDAALGQLPKAVARNTLRRVGMKALEQMADTMRQNAPDDPETHGNDLRSSIGVGTKLSPRQAKAKRSAVRSGEAEKYFAEVYAGAGPLPQAHLTEFGTVHMAPQPWARPAFEQHAKQVIDDVASNLGTEIAKSAARVAKRAAAKAVRAG